MRETPNGEETQMEFLALLHAAEDGWERLSDDRRREMREQYGEFANAARAAGVLVAGDELGATSSATTVRVRDGHQLVTDGPYAEVKEALGGFFILDCASVEDALEWAARIPAAAHGAVEVRPVYVDSEE
jgi:hypothetical protein